MYIFPIRKQHLYLQRTKKINTTSKRHKRQTLKYYIKRNDKQPHGTRDTVVTIDKLFNFIKREKISSISGCDPTRTGWGADKTKVDGAYGNVALTSLLCQKMNLKFTTMSNLKVNLLDLSSNDFVSYVSYMICVTLTSLRFKVRTVRLNRVLKNHLTN